MSTNAEPPTRPVMDVLLTAAESMALEFGAQNAGERIRTTQRMFPDGLITSTSGGVQAAVMLHLLAEHAPEVPVVFVDTGYHFPETYTYLEELRERLPALRLETYSPGMTSARLEAVHGRLWEGDEADLDRYGVITKVEPMNRALTDFGAWVWLSGLRRQQSSERAERPFAEVQGDTLKIYPILDWSDQEVEAYLAQHDLPRHPLAERGYASVGDWHSSAPLTDGMTAEESRFGGARRECGLHLDSTVDDYRI